MDMDGVLVREEHLVPGANRFLARLRELGVIDPGGAEPLSGREGSTVPCGRGG